MFLSGGWFGWKFSNQKLAADRTLLSLLNNELICDKSLFISDLWGENCPSHNSPTHYEIFTILLRGLLIISLRGDIFAGCEKRMLVSFVRYFLSLSFHSNSEYLPDPFIYQTIPQAATQPTEMLLEISQ